MTSLKSGRRGAGGCGPPRAPPAALPAPGPPASARAGQRAAEWPELAGRDDGAVTGEEQLAAESRKGELSGRLAAVRERVAAACVAVGRDPGEVTLVAITKTFPASDVRLLNELGVRDVGENRDQEAAPKAAECADLAPELTWHFVGQLQTNKAASVVRYAASSTRWTGSGWCAPWGGRPAGPAGWSPAWSRSAWTPTLAAGAPGRPRSRSSRRRWPAKRAWYWAA